MLDIDGQAASIDQDDSDDDLDAAHAKSFD